MRTDHAPQRALRRRPGHLAVAGSTMFTGLDARRRILMLTGASTPAHHMPPAGAWPAASRSGDGEAEAADQRADAPDETPARRQRGDPKRRVAAHSTPAQRSEPA